MSTPRRGNSAAILRRIWVLMAIVFADMVGLLIVIPLLPFYAERLGASPFVISFMISAFAIAQLTSAPLWGRISDRYGRKPSLIAGLIASAAAYLLFAVADSIWLLLLSRFVQGAGGGTTGVVQAYVADAVESKDRTRALGWISAATSAGVMLGPVLGSLTAGFGYAVPGVLAAALCLLNALFGARFLTESIPAEEEGAEPRLRVRLRDSLAAVVRRPGDPASLLIWLYAIGMMAFMAMNGVLALFLERRFGFHEQSIGWFYFYVGGISLLMRAVLLGPVLHLLGELRTLRLGAFALALGLGLFSFPTTLPTLALVVLLVPVGTALLFPATTSLVSRHAPPGQVGQMLGVQQAFGGLCRMIGPMWAGAAFQYVSIETPFRIAGALVFAGALMALLGIRPSAADGVPDR